MLKYPAFNSLRFRLLALGAISFAFAFGLVVFIWLTDRKDAINRTFAEMETLAHLVAVHPQRMIESGRDFLTMAAAAHRVQKHTPADCPRILAGLVLQLPQYSNIVLVDINGNLTACATPFTGTVNVSDKLWFKQSLQTGKFSIGEYQIDRTTGKPTMILAYPVKDEAGKIESVLAVGLNLSELEKTLAETSLPKETVCLILDNNGTAIARYPHIEQFVGKNFIDTPLVQTILTKKDGIIEDAGIDGIRRIYCFTSLHSIPDVPIFIHIGIPKETVLHNINYNLKLNIIWLSLFGVFMFTAGWIAIDYLVMRQVNILINTTKKFANGELSARSGIVRNGEISHLAATFDQMAEQMENNIKSLEQINQRLSESEGKFYRLVEFAPDAILMIDQPGRIVLINSQTEKTFGYERDELLGGSYDKLVPAPARSMHQELCAGVFTSPHLNPKHTGLKMFGLRKDGTEFSMETSLNSIKINDQIFIVIFTRDMTHQYKLENQLHQSQKMEVVGQLAGGVAHDFNNVLSAIMGYGYLLNEETAPDSQAKNYVSQLLAAAEKGANLTKGLLAFSRKQVIAPRPVKLNDIIQNIYKLLARIIGEDIKLDTVLTGQNTGIMADVPQIEQVLMNMAINARDAMPKGGTLSIATEIVMVDNEFIKTYNYGTPGKYVIILVTDNGCGMGEQVRTRIFEPFFTTKEIGKGTGLGLSIVYGIVKQHNGYINVYSEPDKGTTFKIYFPLLEETATQPAATADISAPPNAFGGTETILVAEDNQDVRTITVKFLKRFGYQVIEAVDGVEAVRIFSENKDRVDLLLLDVIMPRKDGREAYEEIKKIKPDIKALFTSGYTADIIQQKKLFEDGTEIIQKPVPPTQLLRKIREVLDKK